MNIINTDFKGLKIIEPDIFEDPRGWFQESYSKKKFCEMGINYDFVQDNHSYSAASGTLRGIHFQKKPEAQTKLVRCIKGSIIDVVVDFRKGSETYKKTFSIRLSAENNRQLLIPKGFGHAFLSEQDNTEVLYKVDNIFSKEYERSILYNDPEFGITWPIKEPILSDKDKTAPLFENSDVDFSIKVLVTGSEGQLGFDIIRRLKKLDIECLGVDLYDFDITNPVQTDKFIFNYKPDVVVHCAAYTQVDKAEIEKEKCFDINVNGTENIAKACNKIDSKMIYISTDYVFNGSGENAWSENDPTSAINYYGYTKELGERLIREILEKYYIIRTSWLYGINGNNFIKTIIELSVTKNRLAIVDDQIGSPTYSVDLANMICNIFQTKCYGTLNISNTGYCSWYEFAKAIIDLLEIEVELTPIKSAEYNSVAKRPINSRLSMNRLKQLGFSEMPNWNDALKRFLKEYNKISE